MSSQECCTPSNTASESTATTLSICHELQDEIGTDQSSWTEDEWVRYADCFDENDNSQLAIDVAAKGLVHHPNSKRLYNIKAYHESELDRHVEAIETLERGLDQLGGSSDGLLENNLAWEALWEPRDVSIDRARVLYRKALQKRSTRCAYLHTGLWVEYAKAQQATGVERVRALREFQNIRDHYRPCLSRLERGDWKTITEIVGAATLYDEVDGSQGWKPESGNVRKASGDALLERAAQILRSEYHSVSIDAVCSDAMPLETTHSHCKQQLNEAFSQLARESNEAKDASGGGSSGTPCPMAP